MGEHKELGSRIMGTQTEGEVRSEKNALPGRHLRAASCGGARKSKAIDWFAGGRSSPFPNRNLELGRGGSLSNWPSLLG